MRLASQRVRRRSFAVVLLTKSAESSVGAINRETNSCSQRQSDLTQLSVCMILSVRESRRLDGKWTGNSATETAEQRRPKTILWRFIASEVGFEERSGLS